MRNALIATTTVAALALTGATLSRTASTYITLDRDAEPLRSTFNRDSGKTRVVMLVAPT